MARLAEIPGLEQATTDRSGTFLRMRARDVDAVASARAAVLALGHETAELSQDEARRILSSAADWYDMARVRELSREEAGALAEEATSAFERDSRLTGAERERLRSDAADALFASMIAEDPLTGGRLERALPSIVECARPYLAEQRAARLAAVLRAWSESKRLR